MSYRVRKEPFSISGYGTFLLRLSKTQINPGDRKSPTAYSSYRYNSKFYPGKRTYYFRGTVTTDSVYTQEFGRGVALYSSADEYTYSPNGEQRSDTTNQALSKLIRQVQSKRYDDFNATIFGAEAKKSAEMIVSVATRLRKAITAVKRGDIEAMYRALDSFPPAIYRGKNKPSRVKVSKMAADYFCEARYGWAPLINDMKNAAEKIAHTLHVDAEPVMSVKASSSSSRAINQSITSGSYQPWSQSGIEKVSVCHRLHYTVSSRALSMAASLGLTNPFSLAYEVMPLSFVLDWVIPISGFLKEISAFHGLRFQSGTTSIKSNLNYSANSEARLRSVWETDLAGRPTIWEEITYGGYQVNTGSFTRSLLTEFPSTSFPTFSGSSVSLGKALAALSLLRQRVS